MVCSAAVVLVVGLGLAPTSAVAAPAPVEPSTSESSTFTGPEPIVFVHGWNDDASSFDTMLDRFRSAGFPSDRLFSFEYDTDQSSTTTAAELGSYVASVRAATGAPVVDVVAHSLGSLSSRWCIKLGACSTVVDDWVSLGGPNHGTTWASFCFWSAACADMQPGSDVLDVLNAGDETPGDLVRWATYRSTCDLVIVPSESTELAGADNVSVGCMDHNELHTDGGVFAQVRSRVDERLAPSAPRNLRAEPGDREITLRWAPPAVDGGLPITGYRVFADETLVDEVAPPSAPGELRHTLTDLTNGDPSTFTVRAVNSVGAGAASNSVTSAAEAAPPSAPRELTAVPGNRRVDLSWQPPATGAPITAYRVYLEGEDRPLVEVPAEALSAAAPITRRIDGLTNGVAHTFRVTAVNALGEGTPSLPASATPQADPVEYRDVPFTHPFYWEIHWAGSSGIAQGYADSTFRPGAVVTRQAMASFLHGLAGAPPLPTGPPTFSDVSASHPFFSKVAWVAEEGIAQGYADGSFRPSGSVTRQATAAFLHRLAGLPEVPAGTVPPSFWDVPASHPFFDEIRWAAALGIARGYDDRTFRGGAAVTRQAMAAFLFRYDQVVAPAGS